MKTELKKREMFYTNVAEELQDRLNDFLKESKDYHLTLQLTEDPSLLFHLPKHWTKKKQEVALIYAAAQVLRKVDHEITVGAEGVEVILNLVAMPY